MFEDAFLATIDINDIQSDQMQLIAEYCGLQDALTLMEQLPGIDIYVPAAAKKGFDLDYVKNNYTGYNAATVAGMLGINREDVIRLSKQPTPMSGSFSNNHLCLVIERCGIDIAKRLAQNFPGYKFYIPINGLLTTCKRYIEREFNGRNTKELALRCKVSERYVRKVTKDMYEAKAQISLFDEL